MNGDYSVITFANNKLTYAEFALNCAQSIVLFNDIKVYIVSNLQFPIPQKFADRIFILKAKEEHARLGIEGKLYMDEYIQTTHTFFIDSDCLCYGSLTPVFNVCSGMDVSVVGKTVSVEEYWEQRAAFARNEFGITKTITFNGAFYYIRKSQVAKQIYDTARQLATRYDEYGFNRIKNNWKNEEQLISIGMSQNNQSPIADNGSFMADLTTDQRPAILNILKAKVLLRNPAPPNIKHRNWYPSSFSPIIVHFGGNNINSYPYKSQKVLLKFNRYGFPVWFASFVVFCFIHVPYKTYHWLRAIVKN